jgi:hypothetical protein
MNTKGMRERCYAGMQFDASEVLLLLDEIDNPAVSEHIYVKMYFPFREEKVVDITNVPIGGIYYSKACFAFQFFKRTFVTVDDEVFIGERRDPSKTYFPEGKILGVNDVGKGLASQMRLQGTDYVIKTRIGTYPIYDPEKDIII